MEKIIQKVEKTKTVKPKAESLKKQVLLEIFSICKKRDNYIFDNDLVKDVIAKTKGERKFKNPFDVTKVDRQDLLPKTITDEGYALIHLGKGQHQFIKELNHLVHNFEDIRPEDEVDWKYRRSLLNEFNDSESNALSVANNQRILHHFAFGKDTEFDDEDISKRPKTYFPHRTKASLKYKIGTSAEIILTSMQIEVDLTIEFQGTIAVFEAKNGKPDSFSVYQLFHPFLYYHEAKRTKPEISNRIEDIVCVYLVRQKSKNATKLKLWKYTFETPNDITTIKFLKSACYNLLRDEDHG